MVDLRNFLVDKAFREAQEQGVLDDLPGAGKPLEELHEPKDAAINRLLKEAHAKPAVVVFHERIAASKARLQTLTDPEERKEEMRRLADLQTRLAIEQESLGKYG
ncbi:MAG: DnaJ family domain-containing protein [Tropicimonas sp.]|uniref:DnaJ family domain-containing protein n=1 Tax=Tropicimonas sp. TaxID=2067044 RepID=UPI003A858B70